MSHPRERLGALLDGELSSDERRAVEQHLAGCAACAQELAELGVLDEWARADEVQAPAGYFEALPGRVRARLRQQAVPARARRHLPQWALAAAALLLVGLMVPVLFVHRRSLAPSSETAQGPPLQGPAAVAEASPAPEAQPAPELAKHANGDRSTPVPTQAQEDARRRAAPPASFALPPPPAPPAPIAVPPGTPHDEADAPKQLGYVGEAKRDGGPAREAEGRVASRVQASPTSLGAMEPAAAAGSGAPAAPPTGEAVAADRGAGAGRRLSQDEQQRADRFEDGAPALGARRKAEKERTAVDAFALLAARSPGRAEEARMLRRDWRAFADAHPEDPRADEARVRAIEAAALAYRLSGERADREVLDRDAAAYLQRRDAAHKARVAALLGAGRH